MGYFSTIFTTPGYLVKTVNALGYTTNYNYQGNQLVSISDGDANTKELRSIKISYQSTQVNIESPAIDGKIQTTILNIQGKQLSSVTTPINDTERVSSSIGYNALGLVSDLKLPTGASFHVDYNASLKTLTGQNIPVVSRQTIMSNTQYPTWMSDGKALVEPGQVIEYSYGTDGHNYLGYGSGAKPSAKEDPMLVNVKGGYTYQSSQTVTDNSGTTRATTTTYDHFHRPIKVEVYANGQLISQTTQDYEQSTNGYFSGLSAGYLQPISTKEMSFGVNAQGGKAGVALYSYAGFDQNTGLMTFKIDQSSIRTDYQYYPASEAGPFNHLLSSETTTPATIAGITTPSAISTKYPLANINRQSGTQTYSSAYISGKQIHSVTSAKNAFLATENQPLLSVSKIVATENPDAVDFGLTTAETVTSASAINNLRNLKSLNASSGLSATVTTSYHQDNKVAFSPINIHETMSNGDQALAGKTKTISAYTGQLMSEADAYGNVTTYQYDLLGRITQSVSFANRDNPIINNYEYKIDSTRGILSVRQTNVATGDVAVVYYDSLGREIARAGSDVNHSSISYAPDLAAGVRPLSSQHYDALGQISDKTDYIDESTALTTYYHYDVAGNNDITKNPDGSADYHIVDRQHNRSISLKLYSNGQIVNNQNSTCHNATGEATGCQADLIDVDEKNIANENIDGQMQSLMLGTQHYTILTNSNAKFDNGKALYDAQTKTQLSNTLKSLANGIIPAANDLAVTVDTIIANKEVYKTTAENYDGLGRVAVSIDSHGNKTTYHYNDRGDVTQKDQQATNSSLLYQYDPLYGKLTELAVIDHTNNDQRYILGSRQYNELGQLISETVQGATTTYTYNPQGDLLTITKPSGDKFQYTYNELGALVTITRPDKTIQYRYDNPNDPAQLSEVSDENSKISYKYYPDGSTYQTTTTLDNLIPVTNTEVVNNYGVLQQTQDSLSHTTTDYEYDLLGRVITKANNLAGKTTYRYDDRGQIVELRNNALIKRYEYNGHNGLPQLSYFSQTTPDNKIRYDYTMSYDDDGNIVKTITPHTINQYQYDPDTQQLLEFDCQENDTNTDGTFYCPADSHGDIVNHASYRYNKALNRLDQVVTQGHDIKDNKPVRHQTDYIYKA